MKIWASIHVKKTDGKPWRLFPVPVSVDLVDYDVCGRRLSWQETIDSGGAGVGREGRPRCQDWAG
jgi:hypothetical protein